MSTWWQSTLKQRTPKNQSDWLNGYGVLLINVQCHRYLYPYHDIENTGTYNWKHTWNHTVSNHPIHQHGHTNILVCMSLSKNIFQSKSVAIMCGMYIINGAHGPEPRSSGGNLQVSVLIPRPVLMGWRGCASAMGVIKLPFPNWWNENLDQSLISTNVWLNYLCRYIIFIGIC